jgi:hypothetical protein
MLAVNDLTAVACFDAATVKRVTRRVSSPTTIERLDPPPRGKVLRIGFPSANLASVKRGEIRRCGASYFGLFSCFCSAALVP